MVESKDLNEIENWDYRKTHLLIDKIQKTWHGCLVKQWNNQILVLTLITEGRSGNEEIIDALQKNSMIWGLFWEQSNRGGRHEFKIDFSKIGFLKVSEYCKNKKKSRQFIYRTPHRYEWIDISTKIKLIRKFKN